MNFLHELNSTDNFLELIGHELEVGYGDGITGAEAIGNRSSMDDTMQVVAYPVIFAGTSKVAYWLSYATVASEGTADEVRVELRKRAQALVAIHNIGVQAVRHQFSYGLDQLG